MVKNRQSFKENVKIRGIGRVDFKSIGSDKVIMLLGPTHINANGDMIGRVSMKIDQLKAKGYQVGIIKIYEWDDI